MVLPKEKKMEKNEQIRKYELVVIVDAKSTNEAREAIRKEVAEMINKHGGKVINSQVWLEKHKLTFRIRKCGEGTYYLINFEGGNDVVEKVQSGLKLNEKILRFIFIQVEPKGAAEPARV
jgi:small subunit ribosomal protein S6